MFGFGFYEVIYDCTNSTMLCTVYSTSQRHCTGLMEWTIIIIIIKRFSSLTHRCRSFHPTFHKKNLNGIPENL